jgi:hypothetical protein
MCWQGYEKRFLSSSPSAGLENLEYRWTDFCRLYIGGRGVNKMCRDYILERGELIKCVEIIYWREGS